MHTNGSLRQWVCSAIFATAVLGQSSCFNPEVPSGSFRCAQNAPFCPEGQTCDKTGLCITPGKADASLADVVGDVVPDMEVGKGEPDTTGVDKPVGWPKTCTDDMYEGPDGNGSFKTAYEILTQGNVSGLQICWPDDVDYYSYTLDKGERLSVRVDFIHAEGDLDAQVQDALGTRVVLAQGVEDDELLVMAKKDAALANNLDYRIAVFGYEGATNNYSLQISVLTP